MTATALAAVGSNANENGTLLISGTPVTASGTSVDFTGIPSWAKRITVMFNGVSTNGASAVIVRIGTSGGIQTTGYITLGAYAGASNNAGGGSATDGFYIDTGGPTSASIRYGSCVLTLLDSANGTWVQSSLTGHAIGAAYYMMGLGGTKTLSGTLDRVRITTANGTDAFDSGTINIMWE